MITINQLIKNKRFNIKKYKQNKALEHNPQKKGICQKIFTMTPKKPNSALRKVAKIKLNTTKVVLAYIPGENHFIQEHQFVLIRGGRTKDLPGVKYKIIRGAEDVIGVLTRKTSRSKYGTKFKI